MQLPNTSLFIAITDAICSSKSHCYLVPFIRDLIEAGEGVERAWELREWLYEEVLRGADSSAAAGL